MKKSKSAFAILASILGGLALAPQSALDSNQRAQATAKAKIERSQAENTNKAKNERSQVASSLNRGSYYYQQKFLMPHNKESFKQARRKQLKKRSYRKAKRLGQV